jgi:hypothetical protein
MKTLITALAFAALVAFQGLTPAYAQSFDPDVGSGNIVASSQTLTDASAQAAFARVLPRSAQARGAQTQSAHSAFAAVTPFGTPSAGKTETLGTARADSVRQCATLAAPYKQTTWGNYESYQYRSCMAQHGQVE